MSKENKVVGIVFIVILAILFLTELRSERHMIEMEAYEECVKEKYGGRSPSEVYYATGEYPVCEYNQK